MKGKPGTENRAAEKPSLPIDTAKIFLADWKGSTWPVAQTLQGNFFKLMTGVHQG